VDCVPALQQPDRQNTSARKRDWRGVYRVAAEAITDTRKTEEAGVIREALDKTEAYIVTGRDGS